jgi:AAA15 family ATPase/GTPase
MKTLRFQLNQEYKSFDSSFQANLEGNLIILSGVNGSGKSQIASIILGVDTSSNTGINSSVNIDNVAINRQDIDFRSFKDNISIQEITLSTPQTFVDSVNNAWGYYTSNRLNVSDPSAAQFPESCLEAKKIILDSFSEQEFYNGVVPEAKFKEKLIERNFIWRPGDKFTNAVGEIFFSYALKVSEKMKEVSRMGFESSMICETAPWEHLNKLFERLKFDYRFKENYEIVGVQINEQPRLYTLKDDGTLNENQTRSLSELSDGEKTIISLCFASLSSSRLNTKSLLLLDELDAVLNPSLIQAFFTVIQKYFIDNGVMVVMITHSPATISLAPDYAKCYEVFKPNPKGRRILEISRDEYAEMQIANKRFYDQINDQDQRINSLLKVIESSQDILIVTEGKTDWKYMLSALRYFHGKKEFEDIKEEFFYRFGSEQDLKESVCGCEAVINMGHSELTKYLSGLREARKIDINHKIRIGIFDSDTKITIVNDEGKRIFSFMIEPSGISTEFLFTDDEIKTDINGMRLYIGDEFCRKSKIHSNDSSLNIGGDSTNINKAGQRVIVDSGVYNRDRINVALSKENFAKAIFNGDISISEASWEKFRDIFGKIQAYINSATQTQPTTS